MTADETATDWPFDADRTHPLAARRVPVVSNWYPRWKYEVALCVAPEKPYSPWRGLEPTALEADLIVAAIDYRMEYYNEGWKAKMRQRALDVDGSTNTVTLRKRPDGGWQFRRASWTHGADLVPGERVSLPDCLNRCFGPSGGDGWEPADWKAWKERNADLIAAVRAEWEGVAVSGAEAPHGAVIPPESLPTHETGGS